MAKELQEQRIQKYMKAVLNADVTVVYRRYYDKYSFYFHDTGTMANLMHKLDIRNIGLNPECAFSYQDQNLLLSHLETAYHELNLKEEPTPDKDWETGWKLKEILRQLQKNDQLSK